MEAKFIYVGVRVRDMDASVKFYVGYLGMELSDRHRIEATKGEVAFLRSKDGKVGIELNHYDRDSPYNTTYSVGEGLDHLAFVVKDLDEAMERARALGYRVAEEVKTKTERWAYVEDPNGIWIELVK